MTYKIVKEGEEGNGSSTVNIPVAHNSIFVAAEIFTKEGGRLTLVRNGELKIDLSQVAGCQISVPVDDLCKLILLTQASGGTVDG